jgi:hypothetical protein
VLAALRAKFLAWKEQLLPKHPMAEAVNYALGQWQELNVFCSDGAVPIDNNVSEREMKRVAHAVALLEAEENWLFQSKDANNLLR